MSMVVILVHVGVIAWLVKIGIKAYTQTGRRSFLLIVFGLVGLPLLWSVGLLALSLSGAGRNLREEIGLIAPFTVYVLPVVIVTVGLWQLTGLRPRW
jgi:hypothetical protein